MNYIIRLFLGVMFCACLQAGAWAEQHNETISDTLSNTSKKPAEIEADSLEYDQKEGVVTAEGSVEVVQGGIILFADKVIYNQKTNIVEAVGNISLQEPDGNVFFADQVRLKDDLKEGIINNFKIKFADESRMRAQQAIRVNEHLTTLDEVYYSPCKECAEDATKAPLWQVRAKKATVDEKKQQVKYNHAFFELKGVPVLYTPYLSHPTPDADRKSGFLIPKYSTDKIFGTTVKTPYYYNIAPNKDLTLSPIITSKEGVILSGDYRHLLKSGAYNIRASITNPDKVDTNGNEISGNEMRGHIEGSGDFTINEQWSWGFIGKRSTDDTYLEKYNFGYEDVLTSRIFATSIEDRDFIHAEAITFQGLKSNDDPGTTPLILPNISAHYESEAGYKGSRWISDINLMSLTRDEGVSSNRLSVKTGWQIPHITKSGHVLQLKASLRGDGYYVDNVLESPDNANSRELDGLTSRLVPQVETKWTLPVVSNFKGRQVFLEPTANLILSPYGGNPNKIPNEDGQDVEFSDENLFDSNHFTGYDRIESGPRMNYGIRGRVSDNKYGEVNFLFGQNYHAKSNNNFNERSGLDENFSDYVGRVGYQKGDIFNAAYRFRVDNESLSLNRNSVTAGINIDPVQFDIDYLSVDESFETTVNNLNAENREIIIASSSVDLTEQWNLSGSGHRDLESGEWVSTRANILYRGDCVDVNMSWFEEFTRDRDIRPNTTFSLQISLKNLGY